MGQNTRRWLTVDGDNIMEYFGDPFTWGYA